jgi:hypothetical protein
VDPDPGRDGRRGCDGGGPISSPGDDHGKIAAARFADAAWRCRGQVLQFPFRQPNAQLATQHGNGRRYRVVAADDGLHLPRNLEVGGVGQPVGDDGRFQGDERLAILERPVNLIA